MDDIPLAHIVKKKRSGLRKGKTSRRKSGNDDKKDNHLKVQVSKKVEKGGAVGEEDAGDSPRQRGGEDTSKSAMKLKRGADGEMMEAYLSSAKKDLSRCRPRKELPIFRMVDLSKDDRRKIVGKRIKVYWPDSRKWFVGRIQSFDRKEEKHNILYDDGDKESLDLTKERFELEILPSEGFNLKFESRSQKKVRSFDGSEASETALGEKSSKAGDKNYTGSPGTENNEEVGIGQGRKRGSSRRKATSSAQKRRKVNLVNKNMSQEIEKMETDAHDVEAKPSPVKGGEADRENHQIEKIEILKESKDEDTLVMLPPATASCQNLTSSEGVKLTEGPGDEIGKYAEMEITSADTVNVSSNVEVAVVSVSMVQDKVPTEEINKETTIDIVTGKEDDGKPSNLKESSDGFIEEPSDFKSTTEVTPKDSSLGNVQAKLDAENGQPGQNVAGQGQDTEP